MIIYKKHSNKREKIKISVIISKNVILYFPSQNTSCDNLMFLQSTDESEGRNLRAVSTWSGNILLSDSDLLKNSFFCHLHIGRSTQVPLSQDIFKSCSSIQHQCSSLCSGWFTGLRLEMDIWKFNSSSLRCLLKLLI